MNEAQKHINEAVELLMEERDGIYGEWINRYCENENGEIIVCYSRALEMAEEHGEKRLVGQYRKLERLINQLSQIEF